MRLCFVKISIHWLVWWDSEFSTWKRKFIRICRKIACTFQRNHSRNVPQSAPYSSKIQNLGWFSAWFINYTCRRCCLFIKVLLFRDGLHGFVGSHHGENKSLFFNSVFLELLNQLKSLWGDRPLNHLRNAFRPLLGKFM